MVVHESQLCTKNTVYHVLGALSKLSFGAFIEFSRRIGEKLILASNVRLPHLCLAVACDSGLMYLLLKSTNTSSRVFLFGVHTFWNVSSFSFLKECDSGLYSSFLPSRVACCGKCLRKFRFFPIFPSKNSVFVEIRFNIWLLHVGAGMQFPQRPAPACRQN